MDKDSRWVIAFFLFAAVFLILLAMTNGQSLVIWEVMLVALAGVGTLVTAGAIAYLRLSRHVPIAPARRAGSKPIAISRAALKQYADLTADDFVSHPVWVQCHGIDYQQAWYGQTNEETFRPWCGATPVDPATATFLVRAHLQTADGRNFPGYLTPSQSNELGLIQPHLFVDDRAFGFWGGIAGVSESEQMDFHAALGSGKKSVFPISFKAPRELATGVIAGVVRGF